jgi:hypothetical protein
MTARRGGDYLSVDTAPFFLELGTPFGSNYLVRELQNQAAYLL